MTATEEPADEGTVAYTIEVLRFSDGRVCADFYPSGDSEGFSTHRAGSTFDALLEAAEVIDNIEHENDPRMPETHSKCIFCGSLLFPGDVLR